MDNQKNEEALQFFAGAFSESLAEVLTTASENQWQIEVLDKPNPAPQQGTPVRFRLNVQGDLRGDCFVEFQQSEVAELGSRLLARAASAFCEEHAEAVAKIISSAMPGLMASLSPEYGSLTVEVDQATGVASGPMHVVHLSGSCGDQSSLSPSLYFSAQIMKAMAPAEAPALTAKVQTAAVTVAPPVDAINLNLVLDVELNVTLRFGQRQLPLREVLELTSGSVIELDRLVDDPVELLLDGKVIARGEAVIIDGNYGLRVTEIPQPIASHLAR